MKIDRIQYISELAKLGSVTHAARNLHITQSALSQAITSIEEELGVKIFNRSRKGTELTLFGQKIIGKANEIIILYQELKEEANIWRNEPSGKLQITTIPGIMPILVKVLANLKKEHPTISIEIIEKGSQEVVKDVLNNQSDIGLVNVYGDRLMSNELTFETLHKGRIQVCINKDSPLTCSETLTPRKIVSQKLVIYNDEAINWFVEKFEKKHGNLDILFKTNNTDAIRTAVSRNLALTFGFDYSLKYEPSVLSGKNICLDMSHIDSSMDFGIIQSSQQVGSPPAKTFLHQFRLELENS